MIIEDVGEKEKSKHYVGRVLKKRGNMFKREEYKIKGERVGDYIGIHDSKIHWMVERKRDKDFVKSVKEGRLDKQLEKMSRLYDGVKYLVFEGDWKSTLKDYYYFYGKLQSMKVKCAWYGVSFIECKDEEATASFLLLLEKNCKKFENIEMQIHKPNISRSDDQRLIPLMAARGIGKKTAKLLLDNFNSVDTVIALAMTKPDTITSIKGIGKTVISGLKELFTSKEMVIIDGRKNGSSLHRTHKNGNKNAGKRVYVRSKTPYINSTSVHWRRKNNSVANGNRRKL